jgi:hypothetical protein
MEEKAMTLQQKRRAMAEACPGIFWCDEYDVFWRDGKQPVTDREWLYAVHLVEETLVGNREATYIRHLTKILVESAAHPQTFDFALATATESQRLDAFLKVKGLWREGE